MPISIQDASKEEIFLFDNDCFTEELRSSASPLDVFKNTLHEGTQALNDAFARRTLRRPRPRTPHRNLSFR